MVRVLFFLWFENVFIARTICGITMAKKKNEGFQSSAGLVRYFDTDDDSSLKISPYFVIAAGIILSLTVIISSSIWPV